MAAAKKKPWKTSASSRHITNLKQSIFDFQYLWFNDLKAHPSISSTFLAWNHCSFCKKNLVHLVAKAFGQNVSKYGTWSKRCTHKHAVEFQQKCWWNKTASFVPFTLFWRLCILHKLWLDWFCGVILQSSAIWRGSILVKTFKILFQKLEIFLILINPIDCEKKSWQTKPSHFGLSLIAKDCVQNKLLGIHQVYIWRIFYITDNITTLYKDNYKQNVFTNVIKIQSWDCLG